MTVAEQMTAMLRQSAAPGFMKPPASLKDTDGYLQNIRSHCAAKAPDAFDSPVKQGGFAKNPCAPTPSPLTV
ncbi:MAG TPA: hypothetical protein H9772_02760 [Candidatus Oscillibacter pullicola]|nr:hypothetical protein [Candidatus Oscillibacter pullicola]